VRAVGQKAHYMAEQEGYEQAVRPAQGHPEPPDADLPTVSVVIPCRNEAGFIERGLRSWLGNDYPKDKLDVFVVDGMSDDGTRDIVQRLAAENPSIRLLDNPRRIAPMAMNLGIRQSRGELVIIISGHAIPNPGYIRQCVGTFREHPDIGRAGGVMNTINTRWTGKVIAAASSNAVGVGAGNWRLNRKPGYTDDATFGAYRRWVYDRVGLYDERFVRNQDTDFIQRLNLAGIKTYLNPGIVCDYYPRSTFGKLARQHYYDGYWLIPNYLKLRKLSHPRRVVPLLFLLGWLILLAGAILWWIPRYALAAYAGLYMGTLAWGTWTAVRKHGWRIGLAVPLAFVVMHFAYGFGSLWGIWTWVVRRGRTVRSPESYRITR
jgi:glycosyltransferase involved in cell wall biosynthesis